MSNDRQKRAERAEQMRKEREKAEKRQRNIITAIIVVVVIALIAAAGWAIQKTVSDNKAENKVVTPKSTTKDYGVLYTAKDAGGKAAKTKPVRVALYEDLQCPVCKSFEQSYGPVLESMVKSGQIEIEYRLLSFLDGRGSPNEYASRSGSALLCTLDKGGPAKFKQVHDTLYQNQPEEGTAGPENKELLSVVESAGVKGAADCVKQARYAPWIKKADEAAQKANVSGTPTVEVAGKQVEGAKGGVPTMDQIQKAIAAAQKS